MIIAAAVLFLFSLLFLYGRQHQEHRSGHLFLGFLLQMGAFACLARTDILPPYWPWLAWAVFILADLLTLRFLGSRNLPAFLSNLTNKLSGWISQWFEKPEEEVEEDHLEKLLESAPEEANETREVVENALVLNETTLDEICTHRSEMISLSLQDDPAKWRQIILANRHTFYPVTNESEDDIIGVLDTRDYFRLQGMGKKNILDKTVDKPFFVAENTTASELLRKMKQRRIYLAIVLDEYGGVVGLVTLHDIVEELFGDMPEEDQKKQAEIVKLPKNIWRIQGEADLEDVSKALGTKLELDDFETFSGYVLGSIGYIPEDGTQLEVTIGDLNVQIKRIASHRIRQALVKVNEKSEQPGQSSGKQTKEAR